MSSSRIPRLAQPVVESLRELILQRGAEARARARSATQATRAAAQTRAARDRVALLPTDVPADDALLVSVAEAARDAARVVVEAWQADAPDAPDVDHEERDEAFETTLRRAATDAAVPADVADRAMPLARAADAVAIGRMPAVELRPSTEALLEVTRAVAARLDARSPVAVVWSRRARAAGAAVGSVVLLVVLVRALFHPNWARDRPVSLSSIQPGTAPARALVDGVTAGYNAAGSPFADYVSTLRDREPSAVIDLGKVRSVGEVRVYNRGDGFWDEGLPYFVDVSEDGADFHEVAQRTTHFGCTPFDPPWVARFHARARFVRVRASTYLALSEVEVFP